MNDATLVEIVKQYGAPLYLFDGAKIRSQYQALRHSLPDGFEIFYSIKANPLLGICQLFRELGSRIEIASAGELYTALAAGFEPRDIIFTSPGKTAEELEYAIHSNIYSINVEAVEEAKLISELAGRAGKTAAISLRINPDFNVSGASIKMTGVPSQFGIDQSGLDSAWDVFRDLPNIRIIGIHIYTGTQVLDAGTIVANMEEIIKLASALSKTYPFPFQFLDLGGGFGIPYFSGETPLDLTRLKEGLTEVWERYRLQLPQLRVGVESGRFLMAEAGEYITQILYTKQCKGNRYFICDGGSNQHAASAFLGRHVRNNFPMRVVPKADDARNTGDTEEVSVVGPLCTPTDLIGQKVILPRAVPGDLLVVEKSGAYGLTHSPSLFLSHCQPAEVLYDQGKIYVLRERGTMADFLTRQKGLGTENL